MRSLFVGHSSARLSRARRAGPTASIATAATDAVAAASVPLTDAPPPPLRALRRMRGLGCHTHERQRHCASALSTTASPSSLRTQRVQTTAAQTQNSVVLQMTPTTALATAPVRLLIQLVQWRRSRSCCALASSVTFPGDAEARGGGGAQTCVWSVGSRRRRTAVVAARLRWTAAAAHTCGAAVAVAAAASIPSAAVAVFVVASSPTTSADAAGSAAAAAAAPALAGCLHTTKRCYSSSTAATVESESTTSRPAADDEPPPEEVAEPSYGQVCDAFHELGLVQADGRVVRVWTAADVKQAYHRLAKQLHPDVAGGDDERMERVNTSYDLLCSLSAELADRYCTWLEMGGEAELQLERMHAHQRHLLRSRWASSDVEQLMMVGWCTTLSAVVVYAAWRALYGATPVANSVAGSGGVGGESGGAHRAGGIPCAADVQFFGSRRALPLAEATMWSAAGLQYGVASSGAGTVWITPQLSLRVARLVRTVMARYALAVALTVAACANTIMLQRVLQRLLANSGA
ncbi:DNAJ-domain transmembrane-like protein [Novymonas esmeraldas]|uniref:DNAJ-domain transmembrane-like protein n=1 Tax=Novymonas esmeraldas TaxID=1808958 RepID=A0AAW0FAX4_9TRYP